MFCDTDDAPAILRTVTETADATPQLDGDLGWTLGVVFRSYVTAARAVTEGLPGAHRGYQVMAAACRAEPASQTVLAQELGIDRTVMTYLLDDLEGQGLVERRAAPADRRTRLVVTTDAGRALLTELDAALARAEAHVLGGLTPDDQRTFKDLLHRLATCANDPDPGTDVCSIVQDASPASGC
jgi:DNA-binding MarR family transcriptional regulator